MTEETKSLTWGEFKEMVDAKLETLDKGDDTEIALISINHPTADELGEWYTIEISGKDRLMVG
jgi:hypothetical protein